MRFIREASGMTYNAQFMEAINKGHLKAVKVERTGPIPYAWAVKKADMETYLKWKKAGSPPLVSGPVAQNGKLNLPEGQVVYVANTLVLKEGSPIASHDDLSRLIAALWGLKGEQEKLNKIADDLGYSMQELAEEVKNLRAMMEKERK